MTSPNMIAEKQEFLRWFLRNHQLKRREGVWILNYLISDSRLLDHVHFVEDAKYCPRGLVLTAVDSEGTSLSFYKNQTVITDAEKIFHDIRNNPKEALYIQINFDSDKQNSHYIAVWEDNPYAPVDANLSEEEQQIVENVINQSLIDFQRSQVLAEIDQALDVRDEHRFMELSQLLQKIQ